VLAGYQSTIHQACNTRGIIQLMLPNANNLPTEAAQLTINVSVTLAVGGKFGIPEFLIADGALVALWAAVPKTTVHKNNNPLVPKDEIWLAKMCLVAPPTGDTVLPKYLD
jgi:hypothetical protein